MKIDGDFSVSVESAKGADTVRLVVKGRVTSANADILEYHLDEVFGLGRGRIVVNMSQVRFLASGGIRALLVGYKRALEAGSGFFVERPSENVVNVLGMAALDAMILK